MQGCFVIFLRIFIYSIVFLMTVVYFFPIQKAMSYTLDKYGKKYDIEAFAVMNNSYLTYKGNDSIVFYKGTKSMDIEEITISPFILSNEILLSNVTLHSLFAGFVPSKVDYISTKYTVLNPNKLILESSGDFGKLNGFINTTHIFLELSPSALMLKKYSFLLTYFKKENNLYIYEHAL